MRLLKWNGGDVRLIEFTGKPPHSYAILSHTWDGQNTEVTFDDMKGNHAKSKAGYAKIQFCGKQADLDGLEYFWIDTCCINKFKDTELVTSLNSMFRWYQEAKVCYVYLSDVSTAEQKSDPGHTGPPWELEFRKSRWFTRGWTLQELLAPAKVAFYSRESKYLGDKKSLGDLIHDITKIPLAALQDGCNLSMFTTEDRFTWMNGRETTEPEDQAYALLGIVDAYLPFMYGHGKDKAMCELEKAIKVREEGRLSILDADDYLRKRFYTDKRLCIERLSGDTLDIEKCYINLAIVPQQREKDIEPGKDKISSFDIFHRLKVEEPALDNQIELSKLFDSREDPQGRTIIPRRFLIRGRAGVGKTTLCKKMVHEFERHNLWRSLFDRVLWVPLRSIKTWTGDGFSMGDFFFHHYFRDHDYGRVLAKHMKGAVELGNQSGTNSRVLFILDGLDEVSEAWNPDETKYSFLCKLLNQPNVIITCRPHARVMHNVDRAIDLELETIGFYPNQVDKYLEMTFQNPEEVARVQDFLKRFHIIQGLVRIPILLDALCYIWDDNGATNPELQSMTKFYIYIKEKLLGKDTVQWERKKASIASTSGILELERSFKDELALLERLAFTGMANDIIDFEPKTRHAVLNAFKGQGIMPDQSIRRLSFLRTSDSHKRGVDVSYHFLHLTFQEFFAACYFARQWVSDLDGSIFYLDLEKGNRMKKESALSFLAQHKYDPRYDIFWRFVAGLLDEESSGREAPKLFRAIDQQPLDLLGPAHQRLIMHCLNEVSLEMSLRQDLEKRLKVWLLVELDLFEESFLAREMEFPEQVIVDILQEKEEEGDIISGLCEALDSRENLSYNIQQALLARLDDENPTVCRFATHALRSQASKPQVQQALLARLDDKNPIVRQVASNALRSQAYKPQVQQALLAQLDDKDADVRQFTTYILSSQASKPQVQQALLARLDDKDADVRQLATHILSSQASKPQVQQALLARLDNKNPEVCWLASDILSSQASKPQVQQALLARLDGKNSTVRQFAANALSSQASKPQVQQALLARLDNKDADVRRWAAKALGRQAGKPYIQEALMSPLHNASIQSSQASEDEQVLLARLKSKDSTMQLSAAFALRSQAYQPQVQQALIDQLDNRGETFRTVALDILSSHASNPQVRQALLVRLDDTAMRETTRETVAKAILEYDVDHLAILDMKQGRIFVSILIRMSFTRQLSWQVGSNISWLYTPWGLIRTDVPDDKKLVEFIEMARPDGYPADDS